jgi:6-phosphogluconolactonase (cycloisomerase 2 family)
MNLQVSVQALNGFNQPVTVSVAGLPPGMTTTPSLPINIGPGTTQTIVFNAAAGVQPGLQNVSLQATAGQISHTQQVSLSVAQPVYAYIAGTENSTPASYDIAGYAVDANTGALVKLQGAPATLPNTPLGMVEASESGGTFVFILTGTNAQDNTLSGFQVATTGLLTPVQGIAFGNSDGGWITVHPSGRFLYTKRLDHLNNKLCNVAYLIDPATGNLTESSCSGEPAASFVVPPPGDFAYATNADVSVQAYAINRNDGSLTAIQTTQAIQNQSVWATDPLGHALYTLVPNYNCHLLETWAIDSNSGSLTMAGVLTPAFGSYGSLSCDQGWITFTPKGNFGYVLGESIYPTDPRGVFELTIDPTTGNLTNAQAPSQEAQFAQVEPSQSKFMIAGTQVFSTEPNNLVSESIDPNTGALSQPIATVPLPQSSSTMMIVVSPKQ